HFEQRAVVIVHDRVALLDALGALSQGTPSPSVVLGDASMKGKLALLFTGQGSQHAGMGRALYESFPIFRDALDAVCAHLDADDPARLVPRRLVAGGTGGVMETEAYAERPLRDILFAAEGSDDDALLHQTAVTQTALFALEV